MKTVNHIARILEEHPELQGTSVIEELTPLQEEIDRLYNLILENQMAFGVQNIFPAIEESPIKDIWLEALQPTIPIYGYFNLISTPYCPEDKFYMAYSDHDDHIDAHMRYLAMGNFDWDWDDDEDELQQLGLSASEIEELEKHIKKTLSEDSGFNDPKFDKYDVEKIKEKQKKCWHKWKLVGVSPVLGDEWHDCELCGIKKEDHEKNK